MGLILRRVKVRSNKVTKWNVALVSCHTCFMGHLRRIIRWRNFSGFGPTKDKDQVKSGQNSNFKVFFQRQDYHLTFPRNIPELLFYVRQLQMLKLAFKNDVTFTSFFAIAQLERKILLWNCVGLLYLYLQHIFWFLNNKLWFTYILGKSKFWFYGPKVEKYWKLWTAT